MQERHKKARKIGMKKHESAGENDTNKNIELQLFKIFTTIVMDLP